MHLLATAAGVVDGAAEAVDLDQSPGDIVVLTAADSEIALLARAYGRLAEPRPSLRLANLLQLQHNLSVDLYLERTLARAKLIVLRLLGGQSYWSYGLSELMSHCRRAGIQLAVLPGDAHADPQLSARSTVSQTACERLRQYLVAGGPINAERFLRFCGYLLGVNDDPPVAESLPRCGAYRSTASPGRPLAAIIFYRSVVEGGQTDPIDILTEALTVRGIGCEALFVASLKDQESVALIASRLGHRAPDVVINCTSFAVSSGERNDPLQAFGCPVLQAVLSGSTEEAWRESVQGLGPRDLAMNVVLPEIDGRIHTRTISFKSESYFDAATQCRIATYQPVPDRIAFVADLAAAWIRLRQTAISDRRIAIVLANYPSKDGRIANGVGYDTPASTVAIMSALTQRGYSICGQPADGNSLVSQLMEGPTNAAPERASPCFLSSTSYAQFFAALPDDLRRRIAERWGEPDNDPTFRHGAFHLPIKTYGNVAVCIQPSRGYNIDPKSTYHDPALVPPHGYLAFYFWLRHHFGAHAIIHNGKHGNLEWLPGKATALSQLCFPEAALGPLPHIYPFIVNDPGEGTQAKRRSSAVIIDHLTPPLTRAETYGPLKDLEALVDEYYLASGLDHRRLRELRRNILELSQTHRLDADAGFTGDEDADLQRLDSYLCDLKEAQIRDGLHILGSSPQGRMETNLLVAMTRVPRGLGEGGNGSLIRALSDHCGLTDFDPLSCDMAEPWQGPRPPILSSASDDPWRTAGDTVERLELVAADLAEMDHGQLREFCSRHGGSQLCQILEHLYQEVRPRLRSCGEREIASLLAALDGRRVSPGPSGAPTRGRLDVLPTGRNFFSIDNRTVPTPTAWNLGKQSAEELLVRHFQDFGEYPKSIGLSAWGTSNMRTGGDDIAQALAFIGVKPVWEPSSWRVTGFETIPLAQLGRPRVDVTLRISGFFRDAFPTQIELLDKAIRMAGSLEEDASQNPIAARMKDETRTLLNSGIPAAEASHLAGTRIFGSKPGAYGAGLQALIDEKLWANRGDLARAYVTWGSYAYGARDYGFNDEGLFRRRLERIEAVVHNQDNREHDLLDSDDYYQFEGGMTAAVEVASGKRPRVYHNDHSRPERPVIRTLEEEVGRVVRSRVVNPKWIAGVKRHGYKGAFEIAATVDYMFAFAATTGAVKTHHFDLAFDAFLGDEDTQTFIAENNPAALKEIAQRFEEAAARGLWTPRLNSVYQLLQELAK
jgi:cobaltochelatase CobN